MYNNSKELSEAVALLSRQNLQDLITDPAYLDAFACTTALATRFNEEEEVLRVQNERQARINLDKEGPLLSLRDEVSQLHNRVYQMRDELNTLRSTYQEQLKVGTLLWLLTVFS